VGTHSGSARANLGERVEYGSSPDDRAKREERRQAAGRAEPPLHGNRLLETGPEKRESEPSGPWTANPWCTMKRRGGSPAKRREPTQGPSREAHPPS
jgi:hypothetical protein